MSTEKMPMVSTWKGQRIEDLSREELIEAINWLASELDEQRNDKARWMKAADPIKYLMAGA